jgi:hypothetical protein
MAEKWEDRSLFLQNIIKEEFKNWDDPFAAEDRTLMMKILSFTHIKNNYRIKIVFVSREHKYIEISILEKTEKDKDSSMWNLFLIIKKKKFTDENQNEEILRNLQSFKKEIELKELF